jgi:hypothetical protein
MKNVGLVYVVCCSLVLACTSSPEGTPSEDASAADKSTPDKAVGDASAAGTVTVKSDDGEASLSIPEGALPEGTDPSTVVLSKSDIRIDGVEIKNAYDKANEDARERHCGFRAGPGCAHRHVYLPRHRASRTRRLVGRKTGRVV